MKTTIRVNPAPSTIMRASHVPPPLVSVRLPYPSLCVCVCGGSVWQRQEIASHPTPLSEMRHTRVDMHMQPGAWIALPDRYRIVSM